MYHQQMALEAKLIAEGQQEFVRLAAALWSRIRQTFSRKAVAACH